MPSPYAHGLSANGRFDAPRVAGTGSLVARLDGVAALSVADQAALAVLARRESTVPARSDLARDGDPMDCVFVVLEGFACRHKHRANGAHQIFGLLLPGDLCDLDVLHLARWDHGVATLSPCRVAQVPRGAFADFVVAHPSVALALRRAKLDEEARARAWLLSLGIHTAAERLARLLCEVLGRMAAVGLAQTDGCALPLTQVDLAACIGTTSVHVNRMLQELRAAGTIELGQRWLRVLDRPRLEALAEHVVTDAVGGDAPPRTSAVSR